MKGSNGRREAPKTTKEEERCTRFRESSQVRDSENYNRGVIT